MLKLIYYKIKRKIYNVVAFFGWKYNLRIYNKDFFLSNQKEGLKIAEWFISLLQDIFEFQSLIDLGCATGHYLFYALKEGVSDVLGVEGSPAAFSNLLVDKKYIIQHDLRKPLNLNRKYDIALSIEVAEHIDKKYSDVYLKSMCDCSDLIIFTAATPNQGGKCHVNEQPHKWWIEKFKKHSFRFDKKMTDLLRRKIKENAEAGKFIVFWLEPNIMVFCRESKRAYNEIS